MTQEEQRKIMMQKNTEDFNTMRDMLKEIEMKIMQVDPLIQFEFYKPVQMMIFEAWQDACNPDDNFLFKQTQQP